MHHLAWRRLEDDNRRFPIRISHFMFVKDGVSCNCCMSLLAEFFIDWFVRWSMVYDSSGWKQKNAYLFQMIEMPGLMALNLHFQNVFPECIGKLLVFTGTGRILKPMSFQVNLWSRTVIIPYKVSLND